MGRLQCSRCATFTEADSEEEGRNRLDHSIGIRKNKPCEDGRATLIFEGKEIPKVESPKEKSIVEKKIPKTQPKKAIPKVTKKVLPKEKKVLPKAEPKEKPKVVVEDFEPIKIVESQNSKKPNFVKKTIGKTKELFKTE